MFLIRIQTQKQSVILINVIFNTFLKKVMFVNLNNAKTGNRTRPTVWENRDSTH